MYGVTSLQRSGNAELGRTIIQALKEVRSPVRPSFIDHLIQGVEPFARFLRIQVLGGFQLLYMHLSESPPKIPSVAHAGANFNTLVAVGIVGRLR